MNSKKNFPTWIKQIPNEIKILPKEKSIGLKQRFEGLTDIKPYNNEGIVGKICWPNSSLEARVIPEGILPLDKEDGFDHEEKLELFFSKHCPKGLAVWGYGMKQNVWFSGLYNKDFRNWIKTQLIVSPSVLISLEKDIILIADEEWSFSVIGASKEIIEDLERIFGGKKNLKAEFISHLDRKDFGFNETDIRFAKNFILPWCGWKT